nr:unnamed protein product [Callosobruchus chinensis]
MNFRFNKEDIPRLCEALRIPARIVTSSGYAANGVEGLCIFLRRLAYPNRLYDLERIFNRSSSAVSEIISYVNRHIYNEFGGLLEDLNNLSWLNQNRLQQYADVSKSRQKSIMSHLNNLLFRQLQVEVLDFVIAGAL